MDCPLPIIFYGGARGGGKTDGVLGKWAIKESMYGRAFNAVMFRKSTVSAEDAIERSKEIYQPLGAKFSESKLIWRMPNGGRVSFKYLETVSDADQYQGRNLTDAWIEEAGQYEAPDPIDRLNAVLRGVKVPKQLILTGNPGGAGQHWIRDRFKLYPLPKGPKIVPMNLRNGATVDMAVIPSRLQDNQILMQGDPDYINRLQMSGGEKLVQAWLDGDWSAIEGAFFSEWDTESHVLDPFEIPDHWLRFGSFDWGSAKPFSMQWYAVVPDDYRVGDRILPADSIVMYREWYGASGVNKGLKMVAEEVGKGVVKREGMEVVNYRVADPSIFSEDGGPSIAERMLNQGVIFWPADNKRVARKGFMGGWDMVRARLKGDEDGPKLYFFSTCQDAIRTIPALQHDERKPEDLDTTQEDHSADACRYACMSRPWTPDMPEVSSPPTDVWGRPMRNENTWRTV